MKHPEQFEEMVTVTYLIVTGTCVAVAGEKQRLKIFMYSRPHLSCNSSLISLFFVLSQLAATTCLAAQSSIKLP